MQSGIGRRRVEMFQKKFASATRCTERAQGPPQARLVANAAALQWTVLQGMAGGLLDAGEMVGSRE